jgi:hypothetical protein
MLLKKEPMPQADPVLVALDAQIACYRRLAKLAERQRELIQLGQTEQLLQLLGMRQSELDQLSAHERSLAPAKKQWKVYLATLAEPARQRAEAMMTETRTLLEQITAADKNDVLTLQQQKLNLGRQINQTSANRSVNRAYATAAYGAKKPQLNMQT